MSEFIQQAVNGFSLGSTYALLALGLAIVFTIFGLVNFAYGELITIAAYTMLLCSYLGLPWGIQILAALGAATLGSVLMEKIAFKPVRNADPTTMLITSFGVAIAIQAIFSMTISARPRAVPQPDWSAQSLSIGGIIIPIYQVFTILVTVIALALMSFMLKRSTIGLSMRAAAEDFGAARLLGVRGNRVISVAFALSGLLAGVAAILIMTRTGGVVEPTMGIAPVLKAFVAIVIGGIGSLSGAVLGGFILGFLEVALRAGLPSSVAGLADGVLFAVVVIIIVARPEGILGVKERLRT
jgi:branched-chain amino acid transport system permease protein